MTMNVFSWLEGRVRAFFNPGEAELNVPPLEGPLKPNDALDSATVLAEVSGADNLASIPEGAIFTSGKELWMLLAGKKAEVLKTFEHDVSALLPLSMGGQAVGLDGHGISIVGGPHDGVTLREIDGKALRCVTDMAEIGGALWITEGSTEHLASEWLPDLMGKRKSGRICRYELATKKAEVLASGLGWPCGIAPAAGGEAIVSVAWEYRIVRVSAAKKLTTMWKNITGYPGCVRPAFGANGKPAGYWLSVFAMRTKLTEFVLQEDEYRMAMMRDIDPKYWVGPALASFDDHWEPLQGGGIKQLGMIKPWAPPRSYGLVVRLDGDISPVASLHSRAGAHRHGITSAVQVGDELYVTSKGNGLVLSLPVGDAGAAE